MTTARDLVFIVVFLLLCGGLGAAVLLARRWLAGLLTRREWVMVGKIAGILAMLLLLHLIAISRAFPAAMFIYGRF